MSSKARNCAGISSHMFTPSGQKIGQPKVGICMSDLSRELERINTGVWSFWSPKEETARDRGSLFGNDMFRFHSFSPYNEISSNNCSTTQGDDSIATKEFVGETNSFSGSWNSQCCKSFSWPPHRSELLSFPSSEAGETSSFSTSTAESLFSSDDDAEVEGPELCEASHTPVSHSTGRFTGLSRFFGGKSRSFASLSDVQNIRTIVELSKPLRISKSLKKPARLPRSKILKQHSASSASPHLGGCFPVGKSILKKQCSSKGREMAVALSMLVKEEDNGWLENAVIVEQQQQQSFVVDGQMTDVKSS
eukprot:TRINITY_DN416_c2_g1_i2.p1 TRINITY_DN416_c2_g1~~TRINITY_DN416_c2_g1_i2.p1  ORF type:complete len:337 (-),score=21.77 TRINITY_DN416_c2_g1_i2:398-1315(-)